MGLGAGKEGYPDGQRIVNYDGPELFAAVKRRVKPAEPLKTGRLQVSRFATLAGNFFFSVFGGEVNITFVWWTAQTGGSELGSRQMHLANDIEAEANLCIPNQGPWVEVVIESAEEPQISMHLSGSNRTSPSIFLPTRPYLADTEHVFAGAGTFAVPPVTYFSGPAQARLFSGGPGTAVLSVFARYKGGGLLSLIDTVIAGSGITTVQRIIIPATGCSFHLETTGASTVQLAVTPFVTGSS